MLCALKEKAKPLPQAVANLVQPDNGLTIFVYGTLRRDCASGAHERYLQGANFVARAKVRGRLFLVNYYPGLCLIDPETDAAQESWVQGEVYILKDLQQLQQIDRYEGCTIDTPTPHEYTRSLIEAVLATGETLQLWAYLYNGNPSPLAAINSGDFLLR